MKADIETLFVWPENKTTQTLAGVIILTKIIANKCDMLLIISNGTSNI